MSGNELWPYAKHILAAALRYAFFGALLLGAASVLLQGAFYLLGQLPPDAILRTVANWALIGALFGGILGLVRGLLTPEQ